MANSNLNSELLNKEPGKTIIIKYRECCRNHAVLIGGYATDGCREFTPKGNQGTEAALLCQACDCHRNFHRKELIKNGAVILGSHHFPSPYKLHYPIWGGRNILGFCPLPSFDHYHHHYGQNNVQSLVNDEESVVTNGSHSEMEMKVSKKPKRAPL